MDKGRKKLKATPLKGIKVNKGNLDVPKTKEEHIEEFHKLKAEEEALDRQIAELESQGIDTNLKPQMEALHEYNDMKDAVQLVLGYIADIEQITIAEAHKRFNVPID